MQLIPVEHGELSPRPSPRSGLRGTRSRRGRGERVGQAPSAERSAVRQAPGHVSGGRTRLCCQSCWAPTARTRAHTRTHICTHACTQMHTQADMHKCTHAHTRVHTQACMHVCMQTRAHMQAYTHAHMHAHTHAHPGRHTHVLYLGQCLISKQQTRFVC